ncbi:Similar to hypothetical protein TRIVIDRAFT_192994 [Trichoderma virens Gv29-8]; acc. no. EHK19971 [Pyronema omphalodes CBS 100304]|uniref:Uncharacterized protein n=1 Tax=Pyronema omphalodes (strain CBS 100304) TaxID=1076935 RepID=U4L3S1_PYROM|nr:Similar to hypothetical protein TRIVIDRAFT_192994 [Trichoderma virens Gv29-8]; acc. no. EHK19971 [Pyronema omphalodes CBS 100304]
MTPISQPYLPSLKRLPGAAAKTAGSLIYPRLFTYELSGINWADTPRERGTLTILFSCGAALGLCVWTGVHLNVDPGASGGYKRSTIETVSRFLGKSMWALIALFAPDIVLTVALHQFLVAYEYQRAVNKFAEKKNAQSGEGPVVPTETPAANVKRVSTMDSHSEPQKKKKSKWN